MSNILAQICEEKRLWIAQCKSRIPNADMLALVADAPPVRGFHATLLRDQQQDKLGIIAEVKKASPSKGLIRQDFDPAALAKQYQQAGASCVSVLTDAPYFQGSDDDFRAARAAIDLPMIRKDFMIDPYQIDEARSMGADCVLLILAVLDDALAQTLLYRAHNLGMDVLLEIHNAAELDRALRLDCGGKPRLIGVNNRNLKTLKVDINTSLALAPTLQGQLWVAESGISQAAEIRTLNNAGAGAFLIGESLMRQANVANALQQVLAQARACP